LLKKIHNYLYNSTEKINFHLMDVNSSYYSLSEEERAIIEAMITLNL
jgi:hypothetical protein